MKSFVCLDILAQAPEEAVAADRQSIAVLGVVREAEHAAEVGADQEATAYRLALTISAEASLTVAMKARRNRRGLTRVNDDEARAEEGTKKDERVLGNMTASTFGRSRELMLVLIVISGKRRGNEVGRRCHGAEVDHEAGAEVR